MGKNAQQERKPWEVDFVECHLDKSDKEQLAKWDQGMEQTFSILERLVVDGYKLSIWNDANHDSFGASITSPKGSGKDRSKCLTGRGPDFFGALRSVAYKHQILLDGDWSKRGEWEAGQSQWA